ncbi:MAG: hypothetical protein M3143_08540 [Actinomycetota bacterium]|nr:hypothetical protein [Actinomycetota bacterium]
MYTLPSYASLVTITACIVVVPALAAIGYVAARQRGSPRRSALGVALGVGALLVAWLAAAAATGGADVFLGRADDTVPAIAGGLLIPICAGVLLTRIPAVRDALATPRVLALLTLVNTWRVVGIVFITLYLQQLLPAHFALPAGIGDVIIGLAAPVVAYAMWKHPTRRRLPITFHALGLLDLAMAVTLGVTSAPGVLQLFTGQPNTLPMTVLPEVLVPTFLLPIGVIIHITVLRILAHQPSLTAIQPGDSASRDRTPHAAEAATATIKRATDTSVAAQP